MKALSYVYCQTSVRAWYVVCRESTAGDKKATYPVPSIIQIFGLDGRRTELTHYADPHLARGWAPIGVEIPGTGDCPALANMIRQNQAIRHELLGRVCSAQAEIDSNVEKKAKRPTKSFCLLRVGNVVSLHWGLDCVDTSYNRQ